MAQEIADSTLLETWASGGNVVEPDSAKVIEGWQLGEQPPHEYMNWLQNTFGSKLNHILKNGVAKWESEKEFLAGATVQHTGNVWLCKATNTNSEPIDANANWKRFLTVDALADLLDDYVATTGNQTISGVKTFASNPLSTASQSTNANALTKYSAVVKNTGNETITGTKTFSSSPIVPTPSSGTQAANKDYVDANAGEIITAGTGLQKSGTTLSFYPFGLSTATSELTTSDYVVVSDSTIPKKISLDNLMAELGSTTSFQNSKTSNGYQKLPGGLILQWLSFDTLTTGNATYNFPISFPTACLTAVQGSKGSLQASVFGISSFTTTGVTINTSSTTQDGYILAIGY